MSLYEMLEKERREGRREEREACILRLIAATGCTRVKAEEILGDSENTTNTKGEGHQGMQRMRLGG